MKNPRRLLHAATAALALAATCSTQAADGTWNVDSDGNWTDSGNWSSSTIADGSGFTARFINDITANRIVTLNGNRTIGNLIFSDNNASGSEWTVTGNTLTLAGTTPTITTTTNATISSIIAGTSGLVKEGAGTLTLSATNTYTGGTIINTGAISTGLAGGLGGSTNTVSADAGTSLNLTGGGLSYTFGALSGSGAVNVTLSAGGSTTRLINSNLSGFTGILNIGNGTTGGKLVLDAANVSIAASAINVALNGTLNPYIFGTISSPLTLAGGDTGESLGQLRLDSTIYAGNITIAGDITGTGDAHIGGGGTISGNIGESGGARQLKTVQTPILTGTNTYTGGTEILSGTLTLGNGGTTGSLSPTGVITLTGGNLGINRSNNVVQGTDFSASAITGAGGVTKNGTGTLTLNVANTFSGITTISGGTLELTNSHALQNSTLNAESIAGTATSGLKSTVPTLTFGGLTGSRALATLFTTTSGGYTGVTALTLNPGSGITNTYSGAIANGASAMTLTKSGAGTQILTGTNTYTGATQINDGILVFGTVASRSTSTTVTPGGSGIVGLRVKSSDAVYYSAANIGSIFNTNSLTGFNVGSSSVIAMDTTNAINAFDQTVTLTSGRSLFKMGTGTLVLSQANTYIGNTTVSQGTLNVSGSLTSDVTINNGATLSGGGSTTGTLTLDSGAKIVTATIGNSFQADTVNVSSGTVILGLDAFSTLGAKTIGVLRYASGTGPTTANFDISGIRSASLANVGSSGGETQLTYTNAARTWNSASGNWDAMTSTTWQESDKKFSHGDAVTFNDSGTGGGSTRTVTVTTPVTPTNVSFINSTSSYIVKGTGFIEGSTSLTKNGTGSIELQTSANTYSDGTTINSGTLILAGSTQYSTAGAIASGPWGTGNVTFADGTTLASTAAYLVQAPQINILGDMTIGQTTGATAQVSIGGLLDLNNGTRTLTMVNGTATTRIADAKLSFYNQFITAGGLGGATYVQNGVLRLVGSASLAPGLKSVIYLNRYGLKFTGNAGLTIGDRAHFLFRENNMFGSGALAPSLAIESGGVLDLSNGSASTGSTSQEVFSLSGAGTVTNTSTGTGTGTLTVSGSAITTFSGNLADGATGKIALTKSGTGSLTLTNANTYSGATVINGGTLLANNTSGSGTGTGAVTVASGATLGGTGIIAGNTTVSGNLNAGNGSSNKETLAFGGTLSLASAQKTTFDIAGSGRGTTYDGIDVTGALTNGGVLEFNFASVLANGSYTFDLFNFASQSGNFSAVNLVGAYTGSLTRTGGVWDYSSGGNTWQFTQSTGNLAFTAVPEPTTAIAGLLLGAGLLRRRRTNDRA